MAFPVGDWQFWCVTASAVGAVWLLVKPFLGRAPQAGGGCAGCSVAGGRCKPLRTAERDGDRLVVLRGGR